MKPFQARVKYAVGQPKEFLGKLKVNLALVATDERVMDGFTRLTGKDLIRINADADTEKHERLKRYKPGETVMLVKAGDYEGNPYFEVLDMPRAETDDGAPAESATVVGAQEVRAAAELMAACWQCVRAAFEFAAAPNEETLGKMAMTLFISLTGK